MTRFFALLLAAATVLAGVGHAQAQGLDMRDIMGGSPNFFGGGSSPIPRTTVSFAGNYAPGTIFINTAERRLYLVLPNGQALRYGIGVGRDGFRWAGTHRISAKKEWPSWTPPSQMLARRPDLPPDGGRAELEEHAPTAARAVRDQRAVPDRPPRRVRAVERPANGVPGQRVDPDLDIRRVEPAHQAAERHFRQARRRSGHVPPPQTTVGVASSRRATSAGTRRR